MRRLIVLFVSILLISCGRKYTASFYTESTNLIINFSGLPEKKQFYARSERRAYKKANEMLVEMEKNNASDDFVYTKVYVFYASDGSYINIKLADRIELDNPEDATFLAERKKEKTRKQYDNLPTETKVNMYNFYKDPIQEIRDNNYKIKPKK